MHLAGLAASTQAERVAAQMVLADLPLRRLLDDPVMPYETDEVTRLICDTHDAAAFAPIAHLTVGGLRDWLLGDAATGPALAAWRRASRRRWWQPPPNCAACRIW